jgi:two-component system cell cycle response regulator DivK
MTDQEISDWVVLIVDDELDNLDIPKQLFEHHKAEVYTALDGTEGLVVLEKVTPTFILLDLSMPKMDGWKMLKHIRGNPRWSDIIVIALTAHAMTGDEERALAAGFDGYIAKPFYFESFLDSIKDCLASVKR